MLFKDIPGQEDLKRRLIRNVNEGKIPHAQLFLGPPGSASLALALALATYIQCEQKQEEDSCGHCAACLKNQKLIHPDLHFSFPFVAGKKDDHASLFVPVWREALHEHPFLTYDSWIEFLQVENKQLNINIQECHQIHAKLSMKPFEASFQILIMWLPEFLGKEGNSLLKLIEEPSPNTLLIFVAENKDSILPTILSRTQLVKVKAFRDEEIMDYLLGKTAGSKEKLHSIAFLSEGNLGLAMRMLDQQDENLSENFNHWMQIVQEGNPGKIVEWVESFSRSGKESQGREARKGFLMFSMRMIREAMLVSEHADALLRLNEREKIEHWAALVQHENAPLMIAELDKAVYHIERNANPKILFLDVSLRMHVFLNRQKRAQKI